MYTIQVDISYGPMPASFEGKQMSRIVEIAGKHTLEDLHAVIFDAFDREDEHLWEFQIGGKGPRDRKNKRYGPAGETRESPDVTLDSLGLKKGQAFGYLFDFGDEWVHTLHVMDMTTVTKPLKKPKVVKKIGKSPPQYMDEEA